MTSLGPDKTEHPDLFAASIAKTDRSTCPYPHISYSFQGRGEGDHPAKT